MVKKRSGQNEQSSEFIEGQSRTKRTAVRSTERSERAKRVEGKSWREIPIGGVIDKAGSAKEYRTGDWRTFRPVKDEEKCIHCMICWIYCPDSSILVKDEKQVGFDYDHCKGCGICASVCPVKCIKMEKE